MKVGVALGSNVGERLQNLSAARKAIAKLITAPVLASSIYETEPVACEPGAAPFLNATIEFDYEGDPADLLRELKQIETELGRPRHHERNVSRKIDLDLLYFGSMKMKKDKLQVPHPRMHLRRFVLQPLADIRPDLILPGQTRTIGQLLASLNESAKVVRLTENWESP